MAATPLNATTRYTPPGIRKYYWANGTTAIATKTSPTRTELNACTDLTAEIVDNGVSGFTMNAENVGTPDLGSKFASQAGGRQTTEDSEIVFYASQNSNDVRTVLPATTAGFVVILPEGDVAGQKCEVWPAKVRSMFIDPSTEDSGRVHVQFSITSVPAQNVTIPT